MFGDDRVRGTREQMMLQVNLVRRRARAWASLGKFSIEFYYGFKNCKNFETIGLVNLLCSVSFY